MRVLVYTGKGGVGKTTIAGASAYELAKRGKKTLIISTDMAHSLGDLLEIKLENTPTKILENLFAMEIDTIKEGKRYWENLQKYLREILKGEKEGAIDTEEILLFPGLDEVFSLLSILEIYKSCEYDVMVIDCAPTGQTLSLLTYGEKLKIIGDKIVPLVKNMNSIFGSFISKKTTVPKPRDIVFDEFSKLIEKLGELQNIFQNRDITSVRIVTTPEEIVVSEAKKNYTWLSLYGFNVDCVYINKILPDKIKTKYFDYFKNLQKRTVEDIKKSFEAQKIFEIELQEGEVCGMERLKKLGDSIYQNLDPYEIYTKSSDFEIEDIMGTRILKIFLPFGDKELIRVKKDEKDLIISYENETRRFHLDEKLTRRSITKYEYAQNMLKIYMDYE